MVPTSTSGREPNRSQSQPTSGDRLAEVKVAMVKLKVTSARDQPKASPRGTVKTPTT